MAKLGIINVSPVQGTKSAYKQYNIKVRKKTHENSLCREITYTK